MNNKTKSDFALVHDKLKDKFNTPKQEKKRKNQIVFPAGCKNVYIKVFDKNKENRNGKTGRHVTLAKIALDTYPIPTFQEFINFYTTDDYKGGEYEILESEFRTIRSRIELYSKEILKLQSASYHEKKDVQINRNTYKVSSLATPIHDICDVIDMLEFSANKKDEAITIAVAQDLHQAIQRLTARLNAALTPQTNFFERIYENEDQSIIDGMKRKYGQSTSNSKTSKAVLDRYLASYEELTPLAPKGFEPKKNQGSVGFRKTLDTEFNKRNTKQPKE